MINLLTISLTTRCNYACEACPMKGMRNKEDPPHVITNLRLIPFLYAKVDPREWVLELTGGEPGMYDGLEYLMHWLDEHGYSGLVKTNGSLPIPETPRFSRVAAWHVGKPFPKYWDQILIIHDQDGWEDKVAHCKSQGIPYHVIGLDDDKDFDFINSNVAKYSFIDAAGSVCPCPGRPHSPFLNPSKYFGDSHSIDYSDLRIKDPCKDCKILTDARRFVPPILEGAKKIGIDLDRF